ncbi:AidA/PixA family protein [Burkholderia sp. BDU5]|uniref:AidA/PixA family protein n=1 Tax=Burkholderia sp. BDU5 TaxID=1385590 RepID=UPI003FA43BCF
MAPPVVNGFSPLDNPGAYVDYDPVKKEPYVTKEVTDCHFNSLVVGYGKEYYGVTVFLGEVSRRTGQLDKFGYYYWDPIIHCVRP